MLDLRIRFIKPDVAIAHETHELSGMVGPDGERVPPQRELSIRVLVKERGKWLITAFHNTVVRAAVASPSVEGAWRVAEIASRAPGETWAARPGPPAGLYVFSARHYAYFYVPGVQPSGPVA